MIRKKFFVLILLVVSMISATGFVPNGVNAAFDPSNLMSDSVFGNTGTMSASDIDALLNRYSGSCISPNNGFQTPNPLGWNGSIYAFGGNVSAGQAILSAAQFYHINPQVIIATLQKEQSLITGGAGCHNDYQPPAGNCDRNGDGQNDADCTTACPWSGGCTFIAMGNACPYYCDRDYQGFSMQIISGAWTLRYGQQRSLGNISGYAGFDAGDDNFNYSGPMVQGTRKRNKNEPAVYWDGSYSPGDGGTVTITSGATAALYRYTPFKSGNSNFVNIFENTFGFGSVDDGRLQIAHPDGTLIKPATSPEVYLIENGQRRFLTSLGVFRSWGHDFAKLKIATNGDLGLPYGSPFSFREGSLIKGSAPTVYVIQGNQKRSVSSLENFQRLGYNPGDIITIPDSELDAIATGTVYDESNAAHPNSTMVRSSNSPTVYFVIGGERHSMTSLPIFISHRYNFGNVKIATAGDEALPITWPVTWYGEGTVIKGNSPTVYITDLDTSGVNMTKRSFGTYYNFVGLDFRFFEVIQVSDAELPPQNGTGINQ